MEKNDSVFQVSLTEIAFTLILLLVMLLGVRLAHSIRTENALQDEVTAQKNYIRMLQKTATGSLCQPDPNDPIDIMQPCIQCIAKTSQRTKKDAKKLIALGENLLNQWEQSKNKVPFPEFVTQMQRAGELAAEGNFILSKRDLENNGGITEAFVHQQKELADLKSKYTFCKNKAGFGIPPCWLDKDSRPEFIFNVRLNSNKSVFVTPAWPETRNEEATAIPGVKEITKKKIMSIGEFRQMAAPILRDSNEKKPEACRYYVKLQNQIRDRKSADLNRLIVEQYFYKLEIYQGDIP